MEAARAKVGGSSGGGNYADKIAVYTTNEASKAADKESDLKHKQLKEAHDAEHQAKVTVFDANKAVLDKKTDDLKAADATFREDTLKKADAVSAQTTLNFEKQMDQMPATAKDT